MSVQLTLQAVKNFCINSSGVEDQWIHNGTTYKWNLGRETDSSGTVNGVVRKFSGTDKAGRSVWKLAGSIKISSDGTIKRFTGLGKKIQKSFLVPITVATNLEVAN